MVKRITNEQIETTRDLYAEIIRLSGPGRAVSSKRRCESVLCAQGSENVTGYASGVIMAIADAATDFASEAEGDVPSSAGVSGASELAMPGAMAGRCPDGRQATSTNGVHDEVEGFRGGDSRMDDIGADTRRRRVSRPCDPRAPPRRVVRLRFPAPLPSAQGAKEAAGNTARTVCEVLHYNVGTMSRDLGAMMGRRDIGPGKVLRGEVGGVEAE